MRKWKACAGCGVPVLVVGEPPAEARAFCARCALADVPQLVADIEETCYEWRTGHD